MTSVIKYFVLTFCAFYQKILMAEIDETEVQHVGPEIVITEITIRMQNLEQILDNVNSRGKESENVATDHDVKRRISLACGIMQNLNQFVKHEG